MDAKALGLSGEVSDKPFEALRQNRNPITGEPLTVRDHANRVAFVESVRTALAEMERFVAVREPSRVRTEQDDQGAHRGSRN